MGLRPVKPHEIAPFVGQAIVPADSLSAGPAACQAACFFEPARPRQTTQGDHLSHLFRQILNTWVHWLRATFQRTRGDGAAAIERFPTELFDHLGNLRFGPGMVAQRNMPEFCAQRPLLVGGVLLLRRVERDVDLLFSPVTSKIWPKVWYPLAITWMRISPCGISGTLASPSWLVRNSYVVRIALPSLTTEWPLTKRTTTLAWSMDGRIRSSLPH